MLDFDQETLRERLRDLPALHRAVFAASAAQRLLGCFEKYCQATGHLKAAKLRHMLKTLWLDLEGIEPLSSQALETLITRTMALLPNEEDISDVPTLTACAEDAVAAVAYALRVRASDNVDEAVWSARRSYEALDAYVTDQLGVDLNDEGAEEVVLSHDLIQAELRRQIRDLNILSKSAQSKEIHEIVHHIRERRESEANAFIPQ